MSSKKETDPAPGTPTPPRFPRPRSLATRLTAGYAGSAFAVVLIVSGLLYWALAVNLNREDDEYLTDVVHILRVLLQNRPQDVSALRQEIQLEWTARRYVEVYIRILDEAGRPIVETPGMRERLPANLFPRPVDLKAEPRGGTIIRSPSGALYRALAARAAVGPSRRQTRVIQVALDNAREERLLGEYRRRLWIILSLALVVCGAVGYTIARHGIRPVQEIAAAARRIRSTTLHERIEAGGLPAELSLLAVTFNEMLDRLEESFDRLSRFSADIAHELRTPVNNLRGEAEVALGKVRSPEEYRDVLASCLEEAERLSRIIDSLLFLARTESPEAEILRESVDVGSELEAVREFFEAAATDAGVALGVEAGPGLATELDRTLFQRALSNLVANALTHTPEGGEVILSATAGDGGIRIQVSDTGSGIPPEHLPHVFDRFYRADRSRSTASGTAGLGLAIVKSIAKLHGGTVEIASEVGRGTRVTLSIPRAPRGQMTNL